MSSHRFHVGQIVQYHRTRLVGAEVNGDFRVERLLPPDGNEPQYRIRSAVEPTERVAREAELGDTRSAHDLAQELYAARDPSGVPWSSRLAVIQEAWLQAAREALAGSSPPARSRDTGWR